MRKVYFRADANTQIGYGHFIRSLALADMLKEDFECVFFTESPTEYQREEVTKICRIVALPNGSKKFDEFISYLNGDEIIVLDNYFFATDYQRTIKNKGCNVVCIDDMHDKHYVADAVINHGLNDSSKFDLEPYTKLCLGFEWALLRKPFLPKRNTQHISGNWFVSFGGSDIHNLTKKYISILANEDSIKKITVVIGDGYLHTDSLEPSEKVEIVKNLSAEEMRNIMGEAEYALLPASGICIEAIACGCKILSGYYVDNQLDFYNNLKSMNVIYPLEDLIIDKGNWFERKEWTKLKVPDSSFRVNIRKKYIELFKSLKI